MLNVGVLFAFPYWNMAFFIFTIEHLTSFISVTLLPTVREKQLTEGNFILIRPGCYESALMRQSNVFMQMCAFFSQHKNVT